MQVASQSLAKNQSWKCAQNATTLFLRNLVLLFKAFYGWPFIVDTLSHFDRGLRLQHVPSMPRYPGSTPYSLFTTKNIHIMVNYKMGYKYTYFVPIYN